MFVFDSKVATVRPYLLLGAAPHERDLALLRDCGVTHILQVGSELRPSFPDRFEYERVSLDDAEHEDIVRQLPRCFRFIDSARSPNTDGLGCSDLEGTIATCCCGGGAALHAVRPMGATAAAAASAGGGGAAKAGNGGGSVVLVHCAAGMSRSATVVIAYLMASERLPYDSAFRDVKTARPCVYPNLGFLFQLWEWEGAGYDFERWAGWNKGRFAERLAEYRRAQSAAGLHPAVRVRLPLSPRAGTPPAAADSSPKGAATAKANGVGATDGGQRVEGNGAAGMAGNGASSPDKGDGDGGANSSGSGAHAVAEGSLAAVRSARGAGAVGPVGPYMTQAPAPPPAVGVAARA
ncbi:hypothetical protein GPECTOR_91g564 [Gonium pectorale]|uniref:protein-tyrosine-phosphatase n=1 Tax=Gonium pectorale TaxID=33097 RepID=A0A150G279_GONPE|nr:hypothetical protein GPECTOR_91g564 [Gonium pectorale]|eukprot:KXZ43410.1 hypothetical protein GPECTOR_91g564 [Gonium pectorale]